MTTSSSRLSKYKVPVVACIFPLVLASTTHAVVITTNCASTEYCTFGELTSTAQQRAISVNDKYFSNWVFQSGSGSSGDFFNMQVWGLDDGDLDPGPGLLFVSKGSLTGELNFSFTFDVTVTDPSLAIKDTTLAARGFAFGDDTHENASIEIGANVKNVLDVTVAFNSVFSIFDTKEERTFHNLDFEGIQQLHIATSVNVNFASVDEFEMRFSQVQTGVPEPATLFLVGLGLAGLGLQRRKRSA